MPNLVPMLQSGENLFGQQILDANLIADTISTKFGGVTINASIQATTTPRTRFRLLANLIANMNSAIYGGIPSIAFIQAN